VRAFPAGDGVSGFLGFRRGLISLQKDTALVSVLGPIEVLRRAQIDASFTFNYTPYVAAACLFIALTIPMTRFTDWLQERQRRRRGAGASA